ncbi:hypothetical protein Tco_0389758, partial [Tanacetum coccineum]
LVEIIIFIIDSGCSKHMKGNLKLLSNFVEKFLGMVKFRNDQIAPIIGYGDLIQGNVVTPPNGPRTEYVSGGVTFLDISSTKNKERPLRLCHVSLSEWCHVACQPSPGPPSDHRSTVVNSGSQRWPTAVNTAGPPPDHRSTVADHRSTVVDSQSTGGSWSGLDRVLGLVRSGHGPGQDRVGPGLDRVGVPRVTT